MAYVNVCISRRSKEELAWVIDKLLQVISNKMSVIPLSNERIMPFKFKTILYALLCDP